MARRGFAAAACALAISMAVARRGNEAVRNPGNELPFGAIDVPVNGAQVKAQAPIAGWALDDRGIAEIRIYVDAHLVSTGQRSIDPTSASSSRNTRAAATATGGSWGWHSMHRVRTRSSSRPSIPTARRAI